MARPFRWFAHAVPPHWTVPVLQGPLRGARWIAGASNAGCWLGSYELEVQQRLRGLVRPGAVVYDIGANVGFFSLLAARLTGDGGRVYAFEPLPANADVLRRHLSLNHATQVTLFEAAVSDRSGVVCLSGAGSKAHIAAEGMEVRAVALDDLWVSGTLPPADIVKMDVEGAELAALCGMRGLLGAAHPHLLIEFHGARVAGEDMDTLARGLLRDLGYALEELPCGETHAVPPEEPAGGVPSQRTHLSSHRHHASK